MKKLLLLIALPFMFLTLSAQITQEQADIIVIEFFGNVSCDFTLYAKEDVQTGFEITTTTGEILELSYPCWIYFVHFTDEVNGKYMIVKESNGNVLETNVKNDNGPDGLEDWRIVVKYPVEIPAEYSLVGIGCSSIYTTIAIINSTHELENYIFKCDQPISDYPPEVDFSSQTLLLARDFTMQGFGWIVELTLNQICINEYELNVIYFTGPHPTSWTFSVITPKIASDANILLNTIYVY